MTLAVTAKRKEKKRPSCSNYWLNLIWAQTQTSNDMKILNSNCAGYELPRTECVPFFLCTQGHVNLSKGRLLFSLAKYKLSEIIHKIELHFMCSMLKRDSLWTSKLPRTSFKGSLLTGGTYWHFQISYQKGKATSLGHRVKFTFLFCYLLPCTSDLWFVGNIIYMSQ